MSSLLMSRSLSSNISIRACRRILRAVRSACAVVEGEEKGAHRQEAHNGHDCMAGMSESAAFYIRCTCMEDPEVDTEPQDGGAWPRHQAEDAVTASTQKGPDKRTRQKPSWLGSTPCQLGHVDHQALAPARRRKHQVWVEGSSTSLIDMSSQKEGEGRVGDRRTRRARASVLDVAGKSARRLTRRERRHPRPVINPARNNTEKTKDVYRKYLRIYLSLPSYLVAIP